MRELSYAETTEAKGGEHTVNAVMESANSFYAAIDGTRMGATWNDASGTMTIDINGSTATAQVIGEGVISMSGMCMFIDIATPNMIPGDIVLIPGVFDDDAEENYFSRH